MASINLSAGRSIHDHSHCPFNQSNDHASADEVDNFFSNEHGDEINIENENQYSDNSYQSSTQGTPLANRSLLVVNRRTLVTNGSNFNGSGSISHPHASSPQHVWHVYIFLVGCIVTMAIMFVTKNLARPAIDDESRFYNDIDLLGNKYQIHENVVLQIKTGIAAIVERQNTGSFMFVYNSNVRNFDPKQFNTFISDVSNTISKYLRNESTPMHYTLVDGFTVKMNNPCELINTPCELINTFLEDLHKTGVMLVKHVEAIPSPLAMAFHFYCDKYNPFLKKSAILFTLNLAECSEAADKKPTHAVIEKCLAKKWNSVPADSIGPLLTRVVRVVLDVTCVF